MLNLDDYVISPRHIANGQGAWTGTIREALEDASRSEGTAWGNLLEELFSTRDMEDEEYDQAEMDGTFGVENVAQLIGKAELSNLLDDPNIEIVSPSLDTITEAGKSYNSTRAAYLDARNTLVKAVRDLDALDLEGMSQYKIAQAAGVTQTMVGRWLED